MDFGAERQTLFRFFCACFAARGGSADEVGKTVDREGKGGKKGKEKAASGFGSGCAWPGLISGLPVGSPGDASFQRWLQDRFDLGAEPQPAVGVGDAFVILRVRR